MMRLTSRGLAALLAAGVLVIALALWVSSRKPSESPSEAGELVLPGLESSVNAITEVRISKGDGTHTTLTKGATDWIIGERGFPADSSRVRKLLLDLADLKIIEEKTSDPASYAEIGVDDVSSPRSSGTLIDLVEPGKTVSLIVGKPSGMQSSYVRVAGAKQSLLVSPQVIPDADPRRWLDQTVIDLPETRIEQVRVQPASGPAYTVMRGSVQQLDFTVPDLPKGRKLSSVSAANSVASALSSLTLEDVRKAGGPGARPVHATFRTFDGLTVDVTGRADGDSRYITLGAKSTTKATEDEAQKLNARFGGWEIEILGYRYDSLFQPLDGLLEKPAAAVKTQSKSRRAKAKAAGKKAAS
jgi:hypothetical protein